MVQTKTSSPQHWRFVPTKPSSTFRHTGPHTQWPLRCAPHTVFQCLECLGLGFVGDAHNSGVVRLASNFSITSRTSPISLHPRAGCHDGHLLWGVWTDTSLLKKTTHRMVTGLSFLHKQHHQKLCLKKRGEKKGVCTCLRGLRFYLCARFGRLSY